MWRIAGVFYSIIATTLAGVGVIVVLTAGVNKMLPIFVAAVLGATLALPASYFVARIIVAGRRHCGP